MSDIGTRRAAEDTLAQQLSKQGIRAVPGYTVIDDQARGDRAQLVKTLANQGFDGVIAMRLVGVNQHLQYEPGFDDYWGGAWGTVVPETVVRVEVSAYALPSKQLVWSATSKSVDPSGEPQVIGDVSKVVSVRLAKEHVIGTAQTSTR